MDIFKKTRSYYNDLVAYEFGGSKDAPLFFDYDWSKIETYFLGDAIVKPSWLERCDFADICEEHYKNYILEEYDGEIEIYHYTNTKALQSMLDSGVDKDKLSMHCSFSRGLYFFARPLDDYELEEFKESLFGTDDDLLCAYAEFKGRSFRCIYSYSDDGKDNEGLCEYYTFEDLGDLKFVEYKEEIDL